MSISLSNIVNVNVEVSNPSVISSDFNLGCIIGDSKKLDADHRVKVYSYQTYKTEMVADGFTTSSNEYKAAVAYFSQNPISQRLAIGQKLEGETDLQAITNTRAFNENFYAVSFSYSVVDTSIDAIAAAVEAFSSPTVFFHQTSDKKCLQASQGGICKTLQDKNYMRTCVFYSTQNYFSCAVNGLFSGLNSMQVNSAYTLAYKNIIGFTPESIDDVQYDNLISYNGNSYVEFGRRYRFIFQGVTANGYHVDEVFLLDAAKFLIQQYVVSGLIDSRVISQTNSGVSKIISFCTDACEQLSTMGVISSGIWGGGNVLDLETGDSIPNGYYIQAGSIAEQSASDRAKRVSPPIYICLKASGAIEFVVINVYVNQ